MNETESKKEEVSVPEVEAGIEVFNFEIELETLREAFEFIKTHVDESLLWISEEQWYMKFVDPAHVLMAEVRISNDTFDKYGWKDNLQIGVGAEAIWDFLKICSDAKKKWISGRILTTSNKFRYNMELVVDQNAIRTFHGIDTEGMTEPRIPNIGYPLTTTINAQDLRFGLRQSEQIADHITLIAEDKSLKMTAKGGLDDKFRMLLKNHVDCKELPLNALYSLDYMSEIAKNMSSDEIIIKLKQDHPITMKFMIAEEKISVIVLFSPRIESE